MCSVCCVVKLKLTSLLQFTEIKILSFYIKHKKDQNKKCIFKQQPQKSNEQDILPKNLQIDQAFFPSYGTHAMNYFVSLIGIFMHQDGGRRCNKITAFYI